MNHISLFLTPHHLPSKFPFPADLSSPSLMASFSPMHFSLLSSCILLQILYQYATLTLLKFYSLYLLPFTASPSPPPQTFVTGYARALQVRLHLWSLYSSWLFTAC